MSNIANEEIPSNDLERIQSGVPRLDYILKGGFLKGGTYTIMGPPGSGKTIFGNQICFNHIKLENGSCVYVTLVAETHGKMLKHLSSMKFFNPEVIPERLFYTSGYRALKNEKLEGLLELIQKVMRERKATLLIIDGIQTANRCTDGNMNFEEFLHELQAYSNILGCTTLLLTPSRHAMSDEIDNVIVDGVIEMSYQLIGPRAVRELTVHKFRGSDFLVGKHETEITSNGLMIHPRTEIQFDQPSSHGIEERIRMGFGIPKLDEMLMGGLMSGTTTVLLGSPGTGKTMIGLSYLVEGAKNGQKGIYFGFYEPPPRLIEKAQRIGIELGKYVDNGMIEIIWQPPLEHYMDSLAEKLLEKIKAEQQEKRRLFIDGAEGFRSAAIYQDRMPRFLSAFTNQLRTQDVTTVISEELDLYKSEVDLPNPELATVTEGVILVRYVELKSHIHRLISILKMRESMYDTSIREFDIRPEGIIVADSFQSAEAVLSGKSQLLSGRAPQLEGKLDHARKVVNKIIKRGDGK